MPSIIDEQSPWLSRGLFSCARSFPAKTSRAGARKLASTSVYGGFAIGNQTTEAQDQTRRSAAARQFAIDAARLAAHTRCHSVVVLDVSGLSPVTDFFVLATGTSPRQMRTVVEEIGELGEKHDFAPFTESGTEGESWMLLDCIDVVVHIFSADARQFYDLDGLWGDAKRVEWEDANPAGERTM